MGVTHALRRTRRPTGLDHARGKGLTLQVSLCVGGTRGYTVSTEDMLTCTAPVLPTLSDYSLHPQRAHLAVMVTPRTHYHFVMQARALRVPEACVNHFPPSCLFAYPFTKMEYRVFVHVGAP